MKRVGLVTCRDLPKLSESDQLLVEPMLGEGFIAEATPWDHPHTKWDQFDALILRSCWNYPDHYQKFLDWIKQIEILGIPLFNPPDIVRWNMHKSYLFDLAKRGIPIIPTVIKPTIGNREKGVEYLIQPFMPEVVNQGEYRFIFIGGRLTHTILRTPKKIMLVQPTQTLVRQAQKVMRAIPIKPLYTRVDGIVHDGIFLLMELELTEPQLYFDMNPKATVVFARALKKIYG